MLVGMASAGRGRRRWKCPHRIFAALLCIGTLSTCTAVCDSAFAFRVKGRQKEIGSGELRTVIAHACTKSARRHKNAKQ
ncbi:uncharacterized protein SCHCODRAFT_02057700 [Schizophyllum commune H4-8]|uniref:uncharacterized protein n=1 Tax=Schizophyllum commune (strain H4-8 / FGSC 9210) TaxID=578458 RepID=UPI00216014FE|nr:uncharacterized protein SCHCODRAFT_02057700 [Schizophyllum commune H4-8]KAI5888581.1 hypothetical protein SCHCODRAFT_02057700 [Schizophyllum commune H4-8]